MIAMATKATAITMPVRRIIRSGVLAITKIVARMSHVRNGGVSGKSIFETKGITKQSSNLLLNLTNHPTQSATCCATSLAARLSAGPTAPTLGVTPGTVLSNRRVATVPSAWVKIPSNRTTTELLPAS